MRFSIRITENASGHIDVIAGEFSDEEAQVLRRFATYAREREAAHMLAGRRSLNTTVSWTESGGWRVEGVPPAIEVRELLLLLRPFVLEDEPTYFNRVVNILARRLGHAVLRAKFEAAKRRFSGKDLEEVVRAQIGDVTINSERTFRQWLYGYQYHRDEDKRRWFASLHEGHPMEVSEMFFVQMLVSKADAIRSVAAFIEGLAAAPSATEGVTRREDQTTRP